MSYLLEALGRGLLADLRSAFEKQLPGQQEDDLGRLQTRFSASPTSLDLAMRLGMAYLREMRLAEACRAFETATQLGPSAAPPRLALACVYDELGRLDRALQSLTAAQACDDRDPAIAFGIAFCHERLGDGRAARQAYTRAIELCPQLRNAYERMAAIAMQAGEWNEAITQYERLAEMEPDDLDVLLTLGNLYLQVQRPVDAIEQYQQALLIEPDGHDGTLATADNLVEEGRLGEAIVTLEKLVHKYPGMAPFHVRLGDLYVKAGDDTRAIEEYHTALATQPSFLEATVKLGTQHMRQGRYVDAAVTFNRAVELNDRLMTAFVGLGVAQYDSGRKHESLATFDLAASLEPSTTLLFSETTRLHLKSEQQRHVGDDDSDRDEHEVAIDAGDSETLLQEALRRHEQALLHSPNHADLHYRYGLLLRQVGRYDEATTAFRSAVAINPNYCKALVKLAICLKEAGAVDEAIATFQRALHLDEKYVDVHYELALLFAQRNQFDLAAEQFEQAAAARGHKIAFRENLTLALQNVGMIDRASATWRLLCELAPPDDAQLTTREQALRNTKHK